MTLTPGNVAKGATSAGKLAIEGGEALLEHFQKLGPKERMALDTLKSDYEDCLDKQLPTWMGYNPSTGFPICRNNPEFYSRTQLAVINNASFFSAEALELQHDCISVIDRRQQIFFSSRRYKIDVTHQLFAEMRAFATNELPHLSPDARGIDVLERRIKYLKRARSYTALEPGITSTAAYARQPILLRMIKTLELAKKHAEEEAAKRCAREKLDDLVELTESIQTGALLGLYHLKRPSKYRLETLRITQIAQGENPDHLNHWVFDQSIKSLIRGKQPMKLTQEVLEDACKKNYFPKIVQDYLKDASKRSAFLVLLNNIYIEMGHFSKIIETVRLARSLAGIQGDQWCYGQEEGKLLINGLLEVVAQSNHQLMQHFINLAQVIGNADEAATKQAKGPKTSKVGGRSFKQLQRHLSTTNKFLNDRKAKQLEIKTDMSNWPADAQEQTQEKINLLGRSVNELRSNYGLSQLGSFAKASTTTVASRRVLVVSKSEISIYTDGWLSSFDLEHGDKNKQKIVKVRINDNDNIFVPSDLEQYVRESPSLFLGRNLRYRYFLNKSKRFEAFGEAYAYLKQLKEVGIHSIDDLSLVNPEEIKKALTVCQEEQSRIKIERRRLRFYHSKSKQFLDSWKILVNRREKLFQGVINDVTDQVQSVITQLMKSDFNASTQPQYKSAFQLLEAIQLNQLTCLPMQFQQFIGHFKKWFLSAGKSVADSSEGGTSSTSRVINRIPVNYGLNAKKSADLDQLITEVNESNKRISLIDVDSFLENIDRLDTTENPGVSLESTNSLTQ